MPRDAHLYPCATSCSWPDRCWPGESWALLRLILGDIGARFGACVSWDGVWLACGAASSLLGCSQLSPAGLFKAFRLSWHGSGSTLQHESLALFHNCVALQRQRACRAP